MSSNPLMMGMLATAVPNRIPELADWEQERRQERMIELSGILSGPGSEDLLYPGKRTREMFGLLVEALAHGSYAAGGVPFDGVTFCARHGGLVARDGHLCAQCVADWPAEVRP